MITSLRNFWDALLLGSIIVFFFFSFYEESVDGINFSILALIISNVLACRKDLRRTIIFIVFNLTFFIFIFGRTFIGFIAPKLEASTPQLFVHPVSEFIASLLVFAVLAAIRVVYTLAQPSLESTAPVATHSPYLQKVRYWAQILVFTTIGPYLVVLIERVFFVRQASYDAYYTDFATNLPLIFTRFANLYEPLLLLYLATWPGRRGTTIHLLIYVALGALSLGWGQRNGFALALLFAVMYLGLRDHITPMAKQWLSRRLVWTGLLASIPLTIFMAIFTFTRSGREALTLSYLEWIGQFLVAQGSSFQVVSYTVQNAAVFPEGKLYSLGPLIAFFNENIITQAFTDSVIYGQATAALALLGNNFSFAFAYIANPGYYLSGGGYGSNFIAELWIDFGTIGVVAGGIIYGVLLARFPRWVTKGGPFVGALLLAAALQLIYSPRGEFLGFISPILSMPTVAAYLAVHFLARMSLQRNLGGRQA